MFQSVGTIEEMLTSLTHQMRIYLADMPRQVRGEIDLLRSDALPPSTAEVVLRDPTWPPERRIAPPAPPS